MNQPQHQSLQKDQLVQALYPCIPPGHLTVSSRIDSTHQRLLDATNQPSGSAWLADYQSAGRGRRGDSWQSNPGDNLLLSLLWDFDQNRDVGALGLAWAIALVRRLTELGCTDLRIKWPNDLCHQQRKWAGLLLQSRIVGHHQRVVLSCGINVNHAPPIEQRPTTCLQDITQHPWSRHILAAEVLRTSWQTCQAFAELGFTPFYQQWSRWDGLAQQPVTVSQNQHHYQGIACGINPHGHLIIKQANDQVQSLSHGHVERVDR